jgi:hypothetical protein
MSKVTLTDLTDLTNEISAVTNINNNSATIVTAFDNTLSRDGTSPNQMNADIDLNSNDLLNVGTINTTNLVVGGSNLNSEVQTAVNAATSATASETAAATSATEAATSATNAATDATQVADALAGIGFAAGGTTGQVLAKRSNTDWDTEWVDETGGVATAATRSILAGLSTALNIAYLTESNREGTFQWNSSNLSTQVTADTQQGIYVAPSSDTTGASGAWVRQFTGPTHAKWFGFVPGSGTDAQRDCATAVAALQTPAILAIDGGTYSGLLSEWNYSALDGLIWLGLITFNYSTATTAANFPDNAYVYVGGAALVALPNLATNATIGDASITLASASGLSAGDRGCIFNPTSSSWSGFKSSYNAGEWFQVADGSSDPTLKLQNPLYDSYTTTAVSLYKHPNKKISISGPGSLTIIESASANLYSVAGFRADRIVDSDFHTIHGTNSSYSAMLLNQCIGITGTGYWGYQYRNVGTGTMYGLNIANCQDLNMEGTWYGTMNGCTLGGFALTGCVPNRNIRMKGTYKSDASYGLYGAHMHGNCEYCYYDGTLFGVALAGNHTGCPGATIIDETGARSSSLGVVSIIEPLGFDFDCSGIHVKSQLNDTNGIFAAHGSTSSFNANTIHGGVINLDNSVWDCPHAGRLLDIVNAGSTTTEKIVLSMNGLKWTATDAASPLILLSGLVSPATRTFDELHVAGLVNGADAAWTLQLPCLVGGWKAAGSISITTTTSVHAVGQSITFPTPAPKAPYPVVTPGAQLMGGKIVVPYYDHTTLTATGCFMGVQTPDGTNFSAANTNTATYVAALDEC